VWKNSGLFITSPDHTEFCTAVVIDKRGYWMPFCPMNRVTKTGTERRPFLTSDKMRRGDIGMHRELPDCSQGFDGGKAYSPMPPNVQHRSGCEAHADAIVSGERSKQTIDAAGPALRRNRPGAVILIPCAKSCDGRVLQSRKVPYCVGFQLAMKDSA
jgi:hypothetical protein